MSMQVGGMISGMDTNRMISQLVELERRPIRQVQDRQRGVQRSLQQISRISTAMNELSKTVKALGDPGESSAWSASVSRESALSVRTTGAASPGTFSLEIQAMARAAVQRSEGFASGQEVRAGTLEIQTFGEDPVVVEVAEGATLEEVRDQINGAGASVQATIISTGGERFLRLSGTGTGHEVGGDPADALRVVENYTGGSGQGLGLTTVQGAQNARVEMEGLVIERSSNRWEDVIPGVELEILGAGEGPVQVDVVADREALRENLEKVTEQYNAVVEALKDQAASGLGRLAVDQLRGALGDELSRVGLRVTRGGTLEVEESRLEDREVSEVQAVFGGSDGISARMVEVLEGFTRNRGILSGTRETLESRSRQYASQIERRERSVENVRTRLQRQFSQLEQAMAQMQDAQLRLASLFPMGMQG